MPHSHGSGERSVSLYRDVILGAGIPDVCLCVEWMDLNLVDNWADSWFRGHEFFDLFVECEKIISPTE